LKGFLKSGERRNENEKKIQAERPESCFTPTPPTRPLYVGVGREGRRKKTKDRERRKFNSKYKKVKGKPIGIL